MKTMLTIYADEGKILTNGETYGKIIHLAVGMDASGYYEITEAEYQKMQEENEAKPDNTI